MCSCFVFIQLGDWNSKIRKLNWKDCPMTTVESRSVNPLLLICNPPSSWAKQNKILEIEFFFIKIRPSSSSSCTKINRNLIVNLAPWKKIHKKKMQSSSLCTKIDTKQNPKNLTFFAQKSREMRSIFLSQESIKEYLNLLLFLFFFAVKEWRSWIDAALGFGWCLLKSKAAAASCVASCSNNARAASCGRKHYTHSSKPFVVGLHTKIPALGV